MENVDQNPKQEETFASIIAWGDQVFGPTTAERITERAGEEWDEMELMVPGSEDHTTEAADVIIVLLRLPGIVDAINAKMAKNHARKWKLMGDGTGYHIKEDGSTSEGLVPLKEFAVKNGIPLIVAKYRYGRHPGDAEFVLNSDNDCRWYEYNGIMYNATEISLMAELSYGFVHDSLRRGKRSIEEIINYVSKD